MKILFCFECLDMQKLLSVEVKCRCGRSAGRYVDDRNAEYKGPSCLLGVGNSSFENAIRGFKADHGNHQFDAFTIPTSAPSVKKVDV